LMHHKLRFSLDLSSTTDKTLSTNAIYRLHWNHNASFLFQGTHMPIAQFTILIARFHQNGGHQN